MVGWIIWHVEKNFVVNSLYITSKSFSHWNTLEKWTLAYKIGYIGHTDLISGKWCDGHLRTSHVWFELDTSSSYDLCLVNGLTDRRTDWLMDGRRTTTGDISSAELKAISWAKNQVSNPCRNYNIWQNSWNACNPMGDSLTSCDLNVGHSDLHPCMLVDPMGANNNITETFQLLACRRFVPYINFDKVRFKTAAVTLKNRSRSNDWYLLQVLWRGDQLP